VSGNSIGTLGLHHLATGLRNGPIEKLNICRCDLLDVMALAMLSPSSSSSMGKRNGGDDGDDGVGCGGVCVNAMMMRNLKCLRVLY
jgi:hypothetical protein